MLKDSLLDGKKRKILSVAILVLFLVLSIWFLTSPYLDIFYNVDKLRNIVIEFGVMSPIIFILLMILQILFAPIPGHIVYLAGGYIFGTSGGILYGLIGLTIGTFIAISLGRLLGRPFVKKIIKEEYLNKFDKVTYDYGLIAIFFLFLLPGPPDDAICFIAGLTDIEIKKLLLAVIAGRFPGLLAMVIAGKNLAEAKWTYFIIIILIVGILSVLALKYRKKIMKVRKKI